jgi:hypothetical protein
MESQAREYCQRPYSCLKTDPAGANEGAVTDEQGTQLVYDVRDERWVLSPVFTRRLISWTDAAHHVVMVSNLEHMQNKAYFPLDLGNMLHRNLKRILESPAHLHRLHLTQ